MKTTNLPQLLKVLEMWEDYDTNMVKDHLHKQVSFSSPSTLTWIGGKRNVINYLNMVLRGSRTLDFFLGIQKEYQVIKETGNDYSLRIHQNEGDTETVCLLDVEIWEGKIFCIEMNQVS
jgi:hypothetical protein